jgi:hypothetical protein
MLYLNFCFQEKLKEDLQEERRKYLEEMKSALSEEKERNKVLGILAQNTF